MAGKVTLRDVLPKGSDVAGDPTHRRAEKCLDVEVACEYHLRGCMKETSEVPQAEGLWPGREVYVHVWWKLADGRAVGWNENPSRGWSFPVMFSATRK